MHHSVLRGSPRRSACDLDPRWTLLSRSLASAQISSSPGVGTSQPSGFQRPLTCGPSRTSCFNLGGCLASPEPEVTWGRLNIHTESRAHPPSHPPGLLSKCTRIHILAPASPDAWPAVPSSTGPAQGTAEWGFLCAWVRSCCTSLRTCHKAAVRPPAGPRQPWDAHCRPPPSASGKQASWPPGWPPWEQSSPCPGGWGQLLTQERADPR